MKLLKIFLAEIVSFYIITVIGTLGVVFALDNFSIIELEGSEGILISFLFILCFIFFICNYFSVGTNRNWIKNIPVTRKNLYLLGVCIQVMNLLLMLTGFLTLITLIFWDFVHMSDGSYFLFSPLFYEKIFSDSSADVLSTIKILIYFGFLFFMLSIFVFSSPFNSSKHYPNELPFLRSIFKSYFPKYYSEYVQRIELVALGAIVLMSYILYKLYSLEILFAAMIFCLVPFITLSGIIYGHNFKKLQFLTTFRAYAAFVLIVFSLSVVRAHYLVEQPGVSAKIKLKEILFLGPSLYQLEEDELESFLTEDINDIRIADLMDFLYIRNNKGNSYHRKYETVYDFKEKQPIERFNEIILSKKDMEGLATSIGLFKVSEISPGHLETFFSHARNIENKSKKGKDKQLAIEIFYPVSYYLSWKDFSQPELEAMINSKDHYIQEIALENAYVPTEIPSKDFHRDLSRYKVGRPMTTTPKFNLSNVIVKNFDNFNASLAAQAGELVSQGQCRSISSVSVMKMAFEGQGQEATLDCKSYQNAAGIAEEKDYYLNGQYHWHVKRSLISTDQ